MAVKKLGQPVPLSYFIAEVKRGRLHPAQANTPGRFSALSGLDPGRSVPSSRKTSYAGGLRTLRHSALVRFKGGDTVTTSALSASSARQFFCISSISFEDPASAACARAPKIRDAIDTLLRKDRRSMALPPGA